MAHGLDPATAILEVSPREGEYILRNEDIIDIIDREGDSIAIVLFSGVQYYTGQCFPMEIITKKAKEKVSTIFFCAQEVFHSHWKLAVKKLRYVRIASLLPIVIHINRVYCASHADQLSKKFRAVSVDWISHTQLETFP